MTDPAGPRRDAFAEHARLDRIFVALAHGARRHILLVLRFRGGELTAGQIAERFGCSWPTTSRHLAVLLEAGLVAVEKRGRERYYRLEREALVAEIDRWMRWFEDDAPTQAPTMRRPSP